MPLSSWDIMDVSAGLLELVSQRRPRWSGLIKYLIASDIPIGLLPSPRHPTPFTSVLFGLGEFLLGSRQRSHRTGFLFQLDSYPRKSPVTDMSELKGTLFWRKNISIQCSERMFSMPKWQREATTWGLALDIRMFNLVLHDAIKFLLSFS